jgi:hypothetical protein
MTMRILFVPACDIIYKNRLGQRTEARCEEALQYWQSGEFDYILLSGGRHEDPCRQNLPGAEIMKQWFLRKNLSEESLIMETESLDTFEKVSLVIDCLRKKGLDKSNCTIFVVSEEKHLRRVKLIFKRGHDWDIRSLVVDNQMLVSEKFAELFILLIHLVWPRDGGPIAEITRKKRRIKASKKR